MKPTKSTIKIVNDLGSNATSTSFWLFAMIYEVEYGFREAQIGEEEYCDCKEEIERMMKARLVSV